MQSDETPAPRDTVRIRVAELDRLHSQIAYWQGQHEITTAQLRLQQQRAASAERMARVYWRDYELALKVIRRHGLLPPVSVAVVVPAPRLPVADGAES